jgi:hypothetical protein
MKSSPARRRSAGFASYVLVLSTSLILTVLMVLTYQRAVSAQRVQSSVQLRLDYSEKEDAILRSIVAITPNRAIRAMQSGSSASSSVSGPLRWRNIFTEALNLANAKSSIPSNLLTALNVPGARIGNSGDSALASPDRIYNQISGVNDDLDTSYASAGINRSLGIGFPVPLTAVNATVVDRDRTYPIISNDKYYGTLAQGGVGLPVATYPNFNLLTYPQINFGYAKPGDRFVAKRNWWAFSMNIASHDKSLTKVTRPSRDFVVSIYEVPSQLAISASSFMSLGEYASGDAWQNVSIAGGVFAGKAEVKGETSFSSLSSRRGMTLSSDSTIGGQSFSGNNPFTPGTREAYQITTGDFFPVSLASESGKVAFVPINRGADYFDRLAHSAETNTLSTTTWNNYSIGALQCAMRLDITQVTSATNKMPTTLRFSYMKGGVRQNLTINLNSSGFTGLPPGYLYACDEGQTYNFGSAIVDVAYGKNGTYAYQTGVTGSVTFNNARFGDPLVGTLKAGYYKPSYPFEVKLMASGKICLALYPQRFRSFLASLNADSTAVNHSIVVNADYTTTSGSINITKPAIPCTDLDYGLIIQECANLTSFTKGFSIVSNLRTYIGDDFNIVAATPPTGYTPASGVFYPPCSMFVPEKRFGVDVDPFAVKMAGQVGSLASDTAANPIRPLDSKNMSGNAMTADRIAVNLRPIIHPAELPPITMMNWLVVLEERRKEFLTN